ncbi:MAG: leucyl/phenylalanyl-tRNA--protein transferase [Pseudomonadota bacterium]
MPSSLTPSLVLSAYARGIFPMSESREDQEIFWVDPTLRGIIPLDGFHISRSLRKSLLRSSYDIRIDTAFMDVVSACADRDETWINDEIFEIYENLFSSGHAHSLEVWRDDKMIGGVYGICLRGAFFGESMFSTAKDGSKIALAYLVHRLNSAGFTLFDTQFLTPHLASLGGVEISRAAYKARLKAALEVEANFLQPPLQVSADLVCSQSPKRRSADDPAP